MADEPRRSGRATKGQHHKNGEETPEVPPVATPVPPAKPVGKKGKGKGKGSKKVQEIEDEGEPEAIIRCICGYVEEDPNDKRAMICCDKCSAWQHNVCMGLPEDEDELPDQYFCEQCRPQDHQETVLALKRGQRIWEVRQAEHEKQEEEERQRKKGGRKSRKGRGTKIAEAVEALKRGSPLPDDQSPPPAIPTSSSFDEPVETGRKRKTQDDQAAEDAAEQLIATKNRRVSRTGDIKTHRRQSSQAGQAKASIKQVELQTELVDKIEELHNRVRQRAASAFVKTFEQISQHAINEGTFTLPKGLTKETYCLSLGLNVEFCLYINLWGHGPEPNPAYSEKMRVILHNVKANPELRDRLLTKSLSPGELTEMSSDEMASRELQAEKAQIIKETEKQHILLPETAPKFRKTHKGDELIEDHSHQFVNNEVAPPQLSTRIHEHGSKEESPDRMGSHSPTAFQPASFKPVGRPLTVDTQARRRSTLDRRSSSGFDVNNVWSAVDSPSASRPVPTPSTPGIRGPGAKADPEIDELLGPEDQEEAYSPVDYSMEPGMVWRGNLVMPTVADFKASARYAAGANLESRYPWADLIGKVLWVEGRIAGDVASDYICNLRFSKTTDVSVISLVHEGSDNDRAEFMKLYNYFTTRNRWGVGKSPLPHTRDVYVIPLDAGESPKPEFINLLEESVVPDNRPEKSLLIVYIIKVTQTAVQQQQDTAPTTQHNTTDASHTPMDITPSANGTNNASNSSSKEGGKTGIEAAELVLGKEFITAPTVEMILAQAPTCGEEQFSHIRQCFMEDARTMHDWELLIAALTARAEKRDAEEAAAARQAAAAAAETSQAQA